MVSPEVEVLIKTARSSMYTHPQHLLAPNIRQRIYNALGSRTSSVSNLARGWLAVLAARRVLPIFTRSFPDMPLPQKLLDTAVKVLNGEVDDKVVISLLNQGYHVGGNCWGYDEEDMSIGIDLAGAALKSRSLKTLYQSEAMNGLMNSCVKLMLPTPPLLLLWRMPRMNMAINTILKSSKSFGNGG